MNFHPQMGHFPPFFPPHYNGNFGGPAGGNFGGPPDGNFGALHGGNFGGPPSPFGTPFYGQANFSPAPLVPVPAAPAAFPPTAVDHPAPDCHTAAANAAPTPAAANDEPSPDNLDHLAKEAEALLYGDDEEEDTKVSKMHESSGEYQVKKHHAIEGFFQFVMEHPTLGKLLGKLLPSKCHTEPNHMIPAFNVAIQGLPVNDKKGYLILNCICNAYFDTLKGKDKKKPAEPSSVQTKMKMIFAALKSDYNVLIGMLNLTGQGSFHAYTQAKWKEFTAADPTFGSKPYHLPLLNSEVETMVHMIHATTFPLHKYICQVTVLLIECHYAFRSLKDYYKLEWKMVGYGLFEAGHPFAGQE